MVTLIEVSVSKARDSRPESFNLNSAIPIRILSESLSTANEWQARKDAVFPLKAHCLCCLKRECDDKSFPTLGLFRPKVIERLIIEEDSPTWSDAQLNILRQGDLFEQESREELEKIPYNFRYRFRCDDDACTGHGMICTDWEMGQAWRKWKEAYGGDWESKFRQRYETEMIEKNDTHFYVGTVHQYPGTWIIVGLFYPPRSSPQGRLFA